ncbi:hypothetical protein PTSG_04562 [Salpingoeca rosetta]|uniref:Uncharacterized protein n=1 Tax=Salpingoeca rosetta (strain ATCC 50818 / BSB-021) TaxID=946362 RepID=F2U7S8_SALR5|nr:uncharacterized protein PTSG_04562 [Salpingoeca rosetta]EGD72833.1 hypothetical protein PTSG_04562 [Salpingoeca rosetta]|eukprot:XP_004994656.1 hypothetical protein PTSG_04562 [Salpingoeca rosetta]
MQLLLPPLFPNDRALPIVRVLSKLIHPLVDSEGTFDLTHEAFGSRQIWTSSDRLWLLLSQVCDALASVTIASIAQHRYGGDGVEDVRRAQLDVDECTRDADFHAYTQDSDDFTIRFGSWSDDYSDALTTILQRGPDGDDDGDGDGDDDGDGAGNNGAGN